ncbi:coiled-coil domain-containing protein 115-like [Amphiura filiformis]|uniref:coiled-coil domain-containing protein 115-like n=1 Tax=Amphiura filiformis TaxID=82378 RepID=UPI003B2203B0
MELENICKELDDLAVHYFQILDDLSERKRKVELLLKEGFLNLSKARYSMGNKAVSALQYDSNVMKALVDVNISEEEDDTSTFELIRHKPRPRQASQSGTDSSEHKQQDDDIQAGSQVRRRKVKTEESKDSGNIQSTEDSIILEEKEEIKMKDLKGDGEKDEEVSLVDPLHWFGILVPSALRQGQTNFVQAVEHSVRIASLQNQLMSVQEKYKSLYKTKKQLKMKQDKEQKDNVVEELTSNGVCVKDESDHL